MGGLFDSDGILGDFFLEGIPVPFTVKLPPAKRKRLIRNKTLFNSIVKYQPSDTELVYLGLGKDGLYRVAKERESGKKPAYRHGSQTG